MSYKDKLAKTSDKIRNDLNAKLHGKTYTFNLPTFQGFGGGSFGGAGAGVDWKEYPNNYVELPQYERRTPIITKESFSQAFNRARIKGDPTFEFNGKIYTTEISDNPQYIGKRYQDKTSAVLKEVLDDKMKVMSDSTRIEPFIGQPLGIRKRDESEYKYLDGGVLFGKSGIHIKKKNRGKFTEYCGGKVTEECIAKGKKSKDPKIRKRATFAANARKWKHENGGILKAQEGINELYPAGIAVPSNETVNFFKDFAQRYKKFNGINKNQSISSLISKDKAIVLKRGLPTYNTENKQIFIPSNDKEVSTYSHELVHKLNDLVLERTDKERKLLNDAYPLSIARHVYGRAPEDVRNELIEDEKFSTNTELRRKISSDYGNVLGKKLNKVIKSLSTNDIINYVNNINGYVGESDFLKYPEHIIDGKTLFEHWKEDIGDVPEYYNMPWEELPKSEQNQWQYLYDSREGVAPNYMIFDEDKPKVIKKALIKVAQESKSNDIRSKNFINVSRQGGILKAQGGTGNNFWSKLWNAVKEGGMIARDAKLGAVGAQQVRDLYSEGKNQEAQDLAKQYAKANTTGIALAGGAASTGLLGDLMVTGATTAADTFIDGDAENFGKNLSLNAAFDLVGHGAGKLLRNVDWSKVRNSVESIPDTKADVSEYINTVDDALSERQPLTTNKSKQFWYGTSESKLTDAEKEGVPKGKRNQPIKVKTHNEKQITPLLSAKYIQRFEAPPLDPDYPEISNLQRAKYRRLMDDKFENIFDNTEGFNKTLQSYIDGLPNEIDPRFASITDGEIIQPSIAVRGYRNYLLNNGVDAANISDNDLARLLTQEYKNLSATATGKLKNILLWHGSPTKFDSFDFSKTSANTGNSGALGPGNYFSTHGGKYGHTRNKYDYTLEMNNFQPYIISNITSTPAGHDMIKKGLLPEYISTNAMRSTKNQAILQKWISEIPTNDNRAYIDFTEAVNGYFDGPRAGIMIRRNTGIKSLYPHPSRFIRNADGVVTLKPVDWSDVRVNFKQGGILKAQEGTNFLTPHPLSPVGIALNQAKAMAKMKGEQPHLPPGVKEVVGPDGKKVAIRTEQPLVPLEQSIAEWLPGTGDVAEVGYIADDVKNGRYGSAALTAAMVTLPGNVGKVFRKSDIPTSKLTEAERLGIPKGERNQPAKAPTKNQTYKKTANLESDKDYLEDIEAIQQGFLGKTFLDSEHEALLDWFNSPQYKERLVKQGFSEEQINNLLSNIKDKLSRKNLKYAVDLNSIREWGIGSGGALKIDPQLYPAYEAMTNGNIKIGGHPINWSLIQLKKGVDLDEVIPHEVGGHHLESLVAEFNEPYTSQQITEIGKKATISSGLSEGYYPSWWETRARALTIAKQMREAGWNPNSPEQVNVWLNKHLLKDNNTNVVQGALYYDRPRFIKAVSEGLKNGGKL